MKIQNFTVSVDNGFRTARVYDGTDPQKSQAAEHLANLILQVSRGNGAVKTVVNGKPQRATRWQDGTCKTGVYA